MAHFFPPGIHIGTSGWHYEHWRGRYYPLTLPTGEWLTFYARDFHCVEVNNSFYRLPSPKTVAQWTQQVPDGFIFAVKASRLMTHMKKLKNCQAPLQQFLRVVSGFGDKLGPILFQLPPRWHLNLERLRDFLHILPKEYQYTFEFRDPSWHCQPVYELLEAFDMGFCQFDLAGWQSPEVITSALVYIRLHGPGAAYSGCCDAAKLRQWSEKIKQWAEEGRSVFVFFDNDQNAYAVKNARQLQAMIRS
ncbi:MAG: hypothetical protein AXA67_07065 [Methylothermaceae bacteria B42]|nr:MAG: hypothetical protein AXA67_07065 [Methylothermaceae bacteria B42]HHJ40215.1 DUF72 domain-containing protein [Methylothermaceae bacterium]